MNIIVPGFPILEMLKEGNATFVYRAVKASDGRKVLIKFLKSEYPKPEELESFKREYETTLSLSDIRGVCRVCGLEQFHNSPVMVVEDIGGESLDRRVSGPPLNPLDLEELLSIAVQVAGTLGRIHQRNIIHKDINPSNIVWNRETGAAAIIDFGASASLPGDGDGAKSTQLQGTLAYMSPEQTGRLDRPVDFRTDLYSLGITLYELATGRRPFTADDALEMIHCHIARTAAPAREVDPRVPTMLSRIIEKLMAKRAEDRYQSALGVQYDLRQCLEDLRAEGEIREFELASRDIPERFQVPQKLYGRERDMEVLLSSYKRTIRGGREMVLVSGYAGIGKTSLIRKFRERVSQGTGWFVSGKFEQLNRNVPYLSLIEAFRELMRQLLTESEERLASWKEKLLGALGPNGRIIIDIIPEAELIIGSQPPVPELPPAESKNRFQHALQNFIRVFAGPGHPVIIFLDDLQWADHPSLKLIEQFIDDPNSSHIMIIGAYRDNEVSPGHPLMLAIETIEKRAGASRQIRLGPLTLKDVNRIVADTVRRDISESLPLAELCREKTGGNPFFLIQFLHTLNKEKLISFRDGSWHFDIERIRRMRITDNIVELMSAKILKLEPRAQDALKLASCVGSRFNLHVLSTISERPLAATIEDLREAIQEGLIVPGEYAYRSASESAERRKKYFSFLHDRVQQAAYDLIPGEAKPGLHLKIGRLLLGGISDPQTDENLFEVVNHLDRGAELIRDAAERERLAGLNLAAAKRAKASGAYEPALGYATGGLGLLVEDKWREQYSLALDLHAEAAEAAFFCGRLEYAETQIDTMLDNARSLLDKVRASEVRINALVAQLKYIEARDAAFSILEELGVSFPKNPGKLDLMLMLARTLAARRGKKIEELIDLPLMTDPYKLAASRITFTIQTVVFGLDPDLFSMMALKQVELSLKYGNCDFSCLGYVTYGIFLYAGLGRLEEGCRFGKLSVDLMERLNAEHIRGMVMGCYYTFFANMTMPLAEITDHLIEAYQSAVNYGHFQFAAVPLFIAFGNRNCVDESVSETREKIKPFREAMAKLNQKTYQSMLDIVLQFALNMGGTSADPGAISGEAYNEDAMLPVHVESNDMIALACLYLIKSYACLFFRDYERAEKCIEQFRIYNDSIRGTHSYYLYFYYSSLVWLGAYAGSPRPRRKALLKKIAANQKVLKKMADFAPMNFMSKYCLVEAELARVHEREGRAIKFYDMAIEWADRNRLLSEAALANELAAEFWMEKGRHAFARNYLREARHRYRRWGAAAKLRQLEGKYPQWLTEPGQSARSAGGTSNTDSVIDLASLMKASQAISGEIVMDSLLKELMQIVIQNAGAEKGFLILSQEGRLAVRAGIAAGEEQIRLYPNLPPESSPDSSIDECDDLSPGIVQYAARTLQPVILPDAGTEGLFTGDPHVVKKGCISVLCLPIMHQGNLTGLLYLENNQVAGAFTPERVEALRIISSQAAISLQNAILYNDLGREVAERRKSDEKIRNLNSLLLKAKQITETVLRARTEQDIFQKTCDLLTGLDFIRFAWAGFVDGSDPRVKPVAWSGYEEGYLAEALITRDETQFGRGPTGTAIRTGRVSITADTATDPNFSPWREAAGKRGYASVAAIPIRYRETIIGYLTVYSGCKDVFGAEQIEFLTQTAEDIAVGVTSLRLENELLSKNEQLQKAYAGLKESEEIIIQQEKMASIGQLAAGIAHEIKNPLAIILQGTDFVQSCLTDEQLIDASERVKSSALRADSIIKGLLSYARQTALVLEEVDLSTVIDESITLINHQVVKKGIKVTRHYSTVPPVKIDANQMKQVLINLLMNSIESMERGALHIYLEEDSDGRALIRIVDDGCGMDMETLKKIFDPFFTTKRKTGGTGLGLSITKGIIEKHDGELVIDSEQGKGTTAVISLPCRREGDSEKSAGQNDD